jgi:hypothetical protein
MKFAAQIVIERPRALVIELIRDPAYLSQWQPGWRYGALQRGEQDQVGAMRQVNVEVHGVRLEMVETVVAYSPPEFFASSYSAKGVKNLVENRFYADSPDTTRWVMSNVFQFTGVMGIVAVFIGDFVPKQTHESMRRFKLFAERN